MLYNNDEKLLPFNVSPHDIGEYIRKRGGITRGLDKSSGGLKVGGGGGGEEDFTTPSNKANTRKNIVGFAKEINTSDKDDGGYVILPPSTAVGFSTDVVEGSTKPFAERETKVGETGSGDQVISNTGAGTGAEFSCNNVESLTNAVSESSTISSALSPLPKVKVQWNTTSPPVNPTTIGDTTASPPKTPIIKVNADTATSTRAESLTNGESSNISSSLSPPATPKIKPKQKKRKLVNSPMKSMKTIMG